MGGGILFFIGFGGIFFDGFWANAAQILHVFMGYLVVRLDRKLRAVARADWRRERALTMDEL